MKLNLAKGTKIDTLKPGGRKIMERGECGFCGNGFVILTLVILLCWFAYCLINASASLPPGYEKDPVTGMITWSDSEGRKFMKDPNGNIRELSNR